MKNLLTVLTLSFLLVGCTSVFRSEQLTVDTSEAALRSWVAYYKSATNNAPATEVAKLNVQASKVNLASKQVGASLATLDDVRERSGTNTSFQPLVKAALEGVTAQSSNLVFLIKSFQPK